MISRIRSLVTSNRGTDVPASIFLAGLFLLVSVTIVTYAPSLRMGFHAVDDYTYLYWAGSLPLPQYLVQNLDPRVQPINYRPVRRLLYLVEYLAFGSNAALYHLVQLLIHLANALLVFFLVSSSTHRWRLAFLAALFYAGFPIASEAVLWISDEAALAGFFSLISIFCWFKYLQTKSRRLHFAAFSAMSLALLTKESAAALPLVFFIMDRMLTHERIGARQLAQRYSLVAIISAVYIAGQWLVQRQSLFTTIGRYSIGPHVITNYAAYLAMLAFPWGLQHPSSQDILFWASAIAIGIIGAALRSIKVVSVFLIMLAAIGPVVLGPFWIVPRYLYLAGIPVSIFWAAGFDRAWQAFMSGASRVAISMGIAIFVLVNSTSTAENTDYVAEWSRRERVPFGDIIRQRPTLSSETRFFLVEPPSMTMPSIAGFFFLRYGPKISVSGTYQDGLVYTGGLLPAERARLRNYATAFVYYFDETNRPVEVPVDREASSEAVPAIPLDYQAPIRLEGYELTSSRLRRAQDLVLILYWRALGKSPCDYTVFVHLVDSQGQIITGVDEMPRNGKERTSGWKTNQFTADAHVIRVPEDPLPGQSLRLEVGLYNLETMERVPVVDRQGAQTADRIVIEPFEVVE